MPKKKEKNLVIFLPLAKTSVDVEFFKSFQIAKQVFLEANEKDMLPYYYTSIEFYNHTFPIDANRNECVWKALDGIKLKNGGVFKPDTTIWMDTDQTFPPHTIINLLKRDEPIMAGIYYLKATKPEVPFYPVVFKRSPGYKNTKMYRPIADYPADSVFEVDFLGMGCCRIDREVFETLNPPKSGQFFKYQKHRKKGPYDNSEWKWLREINDVSEDEWFWRQVREKTDYKILVDSSIECGHIGRTIFNGDMYRAYMDQHKQLFVAKHGIEEYDKKVKKKMTIIKPEDVIDGEKRKAI